ncbi:MAG: glutathione S-transferase family protein [Reyranellaceae bacterium]
MKIWGRANSINVQKVLWAAAECGLKYEREDVGGAFGGNDQPWYLKMNPNGVVPTIDDGGRIIWESNSAVRYLAARYASGTLWPIDPGQRSEADRWMDWQLSTISEPMRQVFWGLIRTPPEKRDMAAIGKAAEDCGKLFARLDAHLADRPYVGGGHLTMGDIPVGCFAYRYFALDIKRPELKHLRAWHDRLATRPGFAQHIMIKLT